jgi:death-on-curing protein
VTRYITLEVVLDLHDRLIDQYGGRKGILNLGLLKSALEIPKSSFDGRALHRTVFDKAAAYLFHLARNRPFVDGNKRTAAMATLMFLDINQVTFSLVDREFQDIILQTAQGLLTKKAIAKFLRASHQQ